MTLALTSAVAYSRQSHKLALGLALRYRFPLANTPSHSFSNLPGSPCSQLPHSLPLLPFLPVVSLYLSTRALRRSGRLHLDRVGKAMRDARILGSQRAHENPVTRCCTASSELGPREGQGALFSKPVRRRLKAGCSSSLPLGFAWTRYRVVCRLLVSGHRPCL